MKLSDLPEKPPPNGDAVQSYLVDAVGALVAERASPRLYLPRITLGNLLTIGALLLALTFAYFRGETHLLDSAGIHWTSRALDEQIDQREVLISRPMIQKLDAIAANVDKANARLAFFRSDADTEWQRMRDRILTLEQHGSMRWKGQK